MQSEDGAFFYHRGFLPDALREALIYDLQVKRFARGRKHDHHATRKECIPEP